MRPAKCYTKARGPAYTRREYIGSGLQPKIVKFREGDPSGDFDVELKLVAKEGGQIRHNALEAARVISSKYLSTKLTDKGYYMVIHPYPHHILRENKMMAFAGADRLQDGMRLSFGDPIGLAARVNSGDAIITVRVKSDKVGQAKEALRRASSKLPLSYTIIIKPLKEAKSTMVA